MSNPFMFEKMYPGKDLQDYDAEEAYEMGVSAGIGASTPIITDMNDGTCHLNFGKYNDATDVVLNAKEGKELLEAWEKR